MVFGLFRMSELTVITSYSIHYTKLYETPDDPLRTANIAVFILLAGAAAELVVADQLAPGKEGFFFQSVNIF